jgi:hypothetical protein
VDVPLVAAGCLAIMAAAIHGGGGELLVMRQIAPAALPPSRFGGPAMTRAMLHVSWHLATVAFLAAGVSLVLAGAALDGDAAEALAFAGAGASTAFALVVVGLGAAGTRSPRLLVRHPGPGVLTAIAVLAWWGAL